MPGEGGRRIMNRKYQRFVEMNEEKRDDIIRATLKEFAIYPYDAASINRILENANFSKGGLYHYFEGKKDLFIGVAEYIIEYYYRERNRMMEKCSDDIFVRLKECGDVQTIIGKRYPYYTEFLERLLGDNKDELPDEMIEMIEKYKKVDVDFLFTNIDDSLFKEEINTKDAILLIQSVAAGVQNLYYMEGLGEKNLDERHDSYSEKLFHMFDVLKKMLYK